MSTDTPATLTPEDIEAYLPSQDQNTLSLFITCCTVDVEKPTPT